MSLINSHDSELHVILSCFRYADTSEFRALLTSWGFIVEESSSLEGTIEVLSVNPDINYVILVSEEGINTKPASFISRIKKHIPDLNQRFILLAEDASANLIKRQKEGYHAVLHHPLSRAMLHNALTSNFLTFEDTSLNLRLVNSEPDRKKILVGVSEDGLYDHIVSLLGLGDYIFSCATTAELLFQLLEESQPDLIILHGEMPDMGSEEILSLLKLNQPNLEIPVLMLVSSALGQSSTRTIGKLSYLELDKLNKNINNKVRILLDLKDNAFKLVVSQQHILDIHYISKLLILDPELSTMERIINSFLIESKSAIDEIYEFYMDNNYDLFIEKTIELKELSLTIGALLIADISKKASEINILEFKRDLTHYFDDLREAHQLIDEYFAAYIKGLKEQIG